MNQHFGSLEQKRTKHTYIKEISKITCVRTHRFSKWSRGFKLHPPAPSSSRPFFTLFKRKQHDTCLSVVVPIQMLSNCNPIARVSKIRAGRNQIFSSRCCWTSRLRIGRLQDLPSLAPFVSKAFFVFFHEKTQAA